MFTGIIQDVQPIVSVQKSGACLRVRVKKPTGWKFKTGASVSVDGICSTIVESSAKGFDVEYMPETLNKTTAGSFVSGRVVNLERPLKLSDYVDGHLVLGHVDGRARIEGVKKERNSSHATIRLSKELVPYIVLKGSITVNGIALTVARVAGNECDIALIPHTLAHTNLRSLGRGDEVNIEVDMLARHAVAALRRSDTVSHNAKKRIRNKH